MAEIKFPGGQVVDVIFDETAHTYVVAHKLADGRFSDYKPTHGITAPLEVVPKPYLKPWAAKMATHALIELLADHPELIDKIPAFLEAYEANQANERKEDGKPVMSDYMLKKLYPWYSQVKNAYKIRSEDALEIGTWLHSAIEYYYKSARKDLPVLTEFVTPMWASFIEFDNYFKPEAEDLEFIVYSLMFGYSGLGDFRGKMANKFCIGDWKTTNRSSANEDGISVEYFFQLGGLAQAESERTGKWADDLFVGNFNKEGGEPRVIFASDFGMSPQDCARAYISCFNNYHTIREWDYRYKSK